MARIRKNLENKINVITLWKVAVYIRLSREDGNDESYSVKNQRQRLMAVLEILAAEENVELFDIYIDDGYTGTDSDREDFQRLLTDIDKGKVNCVMVKDLSRLSRNDYECKGYLQHLFVLKDIRFISLDLPKLDTYKRPDEVYDLGVSIQSMYNENHCRETSIKIRGTLNAKREKGEFIGSFAPHGYIKDPKDKNHLIIDEEAAAVIRDIFHLYVHDGISKLGIVRKLIEMGIPCPTVYKRQKGMRYANPHMQHEQLWSLSYVTKILKNKMYLGHMVQGKQKIKSYKVHTRIEIPEDEWYFVENTHEAIIDKETFDKAQELMQRDTRTAPHSIQLYTFSGYLRCADCGKNMDRRPCNGYVYYVCGFNSKTGLCSRHSIRHEKLESIVLETIQKQVALIDDIAQLIDEINNAPVIRTVSKRLDTSLNLRNQELKKIVGLRSSLYMDWKNGDITREEYHSMKKEFEEKEAQLKQDITNLEKEYEEVAQGITSSNSYFESFRKYRNITNLDRGIVTELIKTIHIYEGSNVAIDFNFEDQYQRIVEFIENNKNKLTVMESIKIG